MPRFLEGTERLLQSWLRLEPGQQAEMRLRAAACFSKHFEIGQVTDYLLEALEDVRSGRVGDYTFRGTFRGRRAEGG